MGATVALLATAGIVLPGLDGSGSGPSGPPASTAESQTAPPGSPATPQGDSDFAIFEESEVAGISDALAAIDSGDPLPYSEDGQTFQNREGLLPSQPLGYYSEYTVETPGSPDRGARRLVIGDGGETYYTSDHYSSFTRIDPEDFEP